jgi:hypothetical protein
MLIAPRWRVFTGQNRGSQMRRSIFVFLVLAAALAAHGASASSIVSTSDVKVISLGVNDKGQALVSYTQGGVKHQTLAYSAKNAIAPAQGGKQVNFTYDYSGGYTLFKDDIAKAVGQLRKDQSLFKQAQGAAAKQGTKYTPAVLESSGAIKTDNAAVQDLHSQAGSYAKTFSCKPYAGGKLAFQVKACAAPDGSYWALQQWQRQLPDYGVTPSAKEAADELHLSHWTGPLPVLTVQTDWSYHQWEHLFGTYSYDGNPVFGFKSTSRGKPLDTFGRNVYLDSYNSNYAAGGGTWMRVNSWLTHTNTGAWCYGISPHGADNLTGAGSQYRLTIIGPGVTPDVSVLVTRPGAYDATLDATQNAKIAALHDNLCKPN